MRQPLSYPLSFRSEAVSLERSRRRCCAQVLLPALRDDMARLPLPDDTPGADGASKHSATGSRQPAAADTDDPPGRCGASELGVSGAAAAAERTSQVGNGGSAVKRRYLTCCVRLSPEKEPHRFVELVEFLAR